MTTTEVTGPGTRHRCSAATSASSERECAGLNAAFAASRYMSPTSGSSLSTVGDGSAACGSTPYPYVRLHQPHGMFTAGNVKWTLGRERSYLADKDEVLDHLEHCLEEIRRSVRVDTFFGHTLEAVDEGPERCRVTCRSATGELLTVDADTVIKAYGFRITPNDPLPLSSSQAHSVSPDTCDVRMGDIAADDRPVWIIGGGKTAMDMPMR